MDKHKQMGLGIRKLSTDKANYCHYHLKCIIKAEFL